MTLTHGPEFYLGLSAIFLGAYPLAATPALYDGSTGVKKLKEMAKAAGAAAGGGAVGAGVHEIVGGGGGAAVGTAKSIPLGPCIAVGAGVGLAGYGIYKLAKWGWRKREVARINFALFGGKFVKRPK